MDDSRKWEAVYRLLDTVNTREFDCGTLCSSACCTWQKSSDDSAEAQEMGIYLFPGEYQFLEQKGVFTRDWFTVQQQDPAEAGFPESWTGPVYFLQCRTAPVCQRKLRPLQCRMFPLKPVIDDSGVLELIWNDEDLPYCCPIIENRMPVHDDFYKATYTVWRHLLKDPRFMDLVLSW